MEAPQPIQEQYELDRAVAIYRERQPKRVLEIGTDWGGTLYHWASNAVPGAVIVSVDHGHRQSYKETQEEFSSWLSPEADSMHLIVGDSKDPETIAQAAALGPYDFIFIDGDHGYAGVKTDWENVQKMAAPGAVVLLHDIEAERGYGPCEVYRLWDEIRADGFKTEAVLAGDAGTFGRPLGIGVIYL